MALTKLRGSAQIALLSIDDGLVSATAAIQTSKLADAVKFIFNDGSRAFTSPVAGVTPTDPTHLATKGYVDGISISFANVTSKPTTLAGYGITDAVASSIIGAANGVAGLDATGKVPAAQLPSYVDDADLTAIAALAGTSGFLKKTAANTWALDTSTFLTANQTITLSGDATGSGTTAITVTLANSGVTAGTYNSVTVNAKGLVTAASNVAVLTVANIVTRETPSGLVNGSNTTFTLANTPLAGTEEVFINGLLMEPGAGNDYTIAGAVITTLFTLQTGDKIRVSYFK